MIIDVSRITYMWISNLYIKKSGKFYSVTNYFIIRVVDFKLFWLKVHKMCQNVFQNSVALLSNKFENYRKAFFQSLR